MSALSNPQSAITYLSLFAHLKKDAPHPQYGYEYRFYKTEKVNGKYERGEAFTHLEGRLTGLQIVKKEFEANGIKISKMILAVKVKNGNEIFQFEMSMYSAVSDAMLNTLAGATSFDLKFICGKLNPQGYPSIYVNYSDKQGEAAKINWKYRYIDLPKKEEVSLPDGSKILSITSAQIKFWGEEIKLINEKINKGNSEKENEILNKIF